MLSDLIVCYLFLGGAGAGMCLVLSVMGLLVPAACLPGAPLRAHRAAVAYRRLFAPGYALSLALLALGMVCLLADVGSVDRVLLLFARPSLSFVAVGAWALAACALLVTLLALAWQGFGLRGVAVRVAGVVAVLVALVCAAYTGLLLQSLSAVPLWASPWLPVLFVLSALSCGLAGVLGVAQLAGASGEFTATMRGLSAADGIVVVAEAVAAAVFVFLVSAGSEVVENGTTAAAAQSIAALVSGGRAWLFWGGFVLVGLAVPLVLDVLLARANRPFPGLSLVAAASVLAGGFALRWCIVQAGMHPMLVFGAT